MLNRMKADRCPTCYGKGYITFTAIVDDLCGIGAEKCEHCGGTGVAWVKISRADQLRTMDDWELAHSIYQINCGDDGYCKNLPECAQDITENREIPDERCIKCLHEWLKQEA